MTTKKRRDILVLDYESFWSDDYSLSKMSTIKYVRDPRFKAHGAALRLNGAPAEWVTGSHLQIVLDNDIDWANTVLIGHNLPFDGLILAERNNQWPALYLDTLGMARCLIGGAIPSRSLDALGEHFGLGGKTDKGKALYATKGVRDLSPQQERSMGEYACRDADLTAAIFNRMWPEFPKKLVSTLDWTIRMMTEPGVVLNADIMRECHETEVELKRNAVANCRLTKTQLNSNSQFAGILREHGIEPPTKISRTTGKETYAFSKQDQAFTDLQDDPNPDVRDLVMARLAVKSSIEETRSKAYLELAEDGKLAPIPLLFCGAMQTGRLSGCLVGDTRVWVRRGGRAIEVPMIAVRTDDLVWDGVEFVQHEGLVYSGVREVISYDGIEGTPDHVVFTVEAGEVSLHSAMSHGHTIQVPRRPVEDAMGVGVPGGAGSHHEAAGVRGVRVRPERDGSDQRCAPLQHARVQVVRDAAQDASSGRAAGGNGPPSTRLGGGGARSLGASGGAQSERLEDSIRADGGCEAALYEPVASGLVGLRRAWNYVRLLVACRRGQLGSGELGATTDERALDRPGGQQQGVRAGKPAMGYAGGAELEQARVPARHGGRTHPTPAAAGCGLRLRDAARADRSGSDGCTNSGAVEAQGRRAPTYDIKNCGPRHRFVANGKLVHNSDGFNWQNLGRSSRIRDGVEAPDGFVFVEADSSNIELRVVATFCGQTDLVDMLRAGGDAYSDFASDLFNTPVTKALTKSDPVIAGYRQTGKVSLLSAQYGVGAKTFQKMLWVQAALRVSLDEAERIVKMYRKRYGKISGMWKLLDQQLAVMATGQAPHAMGNSQPVKWHADRIELPSGFCLKYPGLRWVTDSQTGRKQLAFTSYGGKSAGTKYLWGGTLMENCLAGDTQVATSRGWVRLDSVRADDLVWDGAQWVRHGGLVWRGDQPTVDFGGVRLTPDHRVWAGGWVAAGSTDHGKATAAFAQEGSEPDWSAVRHVHRGAAVGVSNGKRRKNPACVVAALRLWAHGRAYGPGVEKGRELWLPRRYNCEDQKPEARHVRASSLSGVAVYARSVSIAIAPGVEELRRAWHSGLRRVGTVVRRFLERHGCDVRSGAGPGSHRQQQRLLARELSVGIQTDQLRQPAEQRTPRDRRVPDVLKGGRTSDGGAPEHVDVPMEPGRSGSGTYVSAEQSTEAVYDLRDCGGRNRFVVRGDDGRPFLVHNCGQALAREIIDPQVQAIRQRYPVVLQVHDAVLALVPESEAEEGTEFVRECMSQAPVWWTDIPIACEAGFGKTYGGIKKS
jgi:DNA polymerase I-like protein with 3'-5' exonuclease and polymerase domains